MSVRGVISRAREELLGLVRDYPEEFETDWSGYVAEATAALARALASPMPDRVAWLCARCGCRRGEHRGSDERCPSTTAFGAAALFPNFFAGNGRNENYEAQVEAYWSTETTFEAKS